MLQQQQYSGKPECDTEVAVIACVWSKFNRFAKLLNQSRGLCAQEVRHKPDAEGTHGAAGNRQWLLGGSKRRNKQVVTSSLMLLSEEALCYY